MKNNKVSINNPDEFNKRLQRTSPFTWIILVVVVSLLISLFVWSTTYKLADKVEGVATVKDGVVTLHVEEADLKKLVVGQKVKINDYNGKIISFNENDAIVSNIDISDGEYQYTSIVLRPIDFLIGK